MIEPDPEHGYAFGHPRDPAPPRGARRYAGFFAALAGLLALSFVPYLGALVAGLALLVLAAELALLAKTRIAGVLTTSLLALFGEASDERARSRHERDDAW